MKPQWIKAGVLCATLIAFGVLAPRFTNQSRAENQVITYQSSEEAAKAFMTFLSHMAEVNPNFNHSYPFYRYEIDNKEDSEILDIISRDALEKLKNDGAGHLLGNMVVALKRPVWEAKSESTADEKTAIVTVVPNSDATREVICIKEGSGWRVDLVATYANWFQLNSAEVEKIFIRAREDTRRASCQSNLKMLSLGMLQYTQDYDERYPPAKQWHDAIMPYVQDEKLFHCPAVASGKNGYAMNWKLSKKSASVVESTAIMALIYESTTLKTNHSGEGHDIAFRHLDGTNIAFADGHVKWFKQNAEKKWPNTHFTFKPTD